MSKLLFLYLLLCCCIQLSHCISGWIEPPIRFLERGDKATFVCGVEGLNESTRPSEKLSFFNQTSGKTIDSRFVRILNSTAVELTLPKVPEQRTTIYCQYNSVQGVTTAELNVGRRPDAIPALDCYSIHWVNISCSFVMPENHVPVQYELKYSQGESKNLKNEPRLEYTCEFITKVNNIFSCFFPDGKYRRTAQKLTFNLTAKNLIGTTMTLYDYNNFEKIIMDVPSDLKHEEPTDKSVVLNWAIPKGKLRALDKAFDFEISVECHCYEDENKSKIISLKNLLPDSGPMKNFSHAIELEYAYTWYDIKIRSKISAAENIEKMWSPWSHAVQVKSKPRLPDFPPEISDGAFNILPNDDVYIYWKDVPSCQRNGDNFNYSVVASGQNGGSPTELKETYAVYRKNKNLAERGTTVRIKSGNSEGLSALPSEIIIPSKYERVRGPKNLQKRLKNGTYIISWLPPDDITEIVSYTVFWCTSKTEGENKCNEKSFNFQRIDANDEPVFHHKSDDTVNFAVSVNTRHSTSGMTWTTCTTGDSNEIGKIKSIWIPRVTSTEIDIKWRLECTDMGIVAGYIIEYCPAKASKVFACLDDQEPKQLEIKENLEHTEYTLTGLAPYKTYGIYIKMFSNSTLGPRSDPLFNTTFEAAPSPVRELLIRKVENTSVNLIWDPPEHFNGPFGIYELSIGSETKSIQVDQSNATEKIRYHWTGLDPYKFYNAAVRACTKDCSNWTQSTFTTSMGSPGPIMEQPIVTQQQRSVLLPYRNETSVLQWGRPKYDGGKMDFYELKIDFMPKDGRAKPTSSIYRFKSRECILDKMCSNNESGSYTFKVRGVNFFLSPHRSEEAATTDVHALIRGSDEQKIFCDHDDPILIDSLNYIKKFDNHSQFFYGPWSPQNGHTCSYGNNDSQNILLTMILVFFSILFIGMILVLYRKIREIKNIIVEFPPGLEELAGDKGKKGKSNPLEKPDLLHNVDNNSILNEDEHKRLLRRSLNGSLIGGDCSSSIHSENTRSELDQNEMGDEIEYNDFGAKPYEMSDNDNIDGRLQSFLLNPATGEEVKPILIPHEPMPTSTPRESPKPHIIMNPSDIQTTTNSGYITAPTPPNLQINSNGYVTPAMFTPIQQQNNNGYTQLNRFGKPILNNDGIAADKINVKTPMVATTDQNGISGYVTHKQLSDFGHRMQ